MKIIQTWGEIGKPPTFYREFDFTISPEQVRMCFEIGRNIQFETNVVSSMPITD